MVDRSRSARPAIAAAFGVLSAVAAPAGAQAPGSGYPSATYPSGAVVQALARPDDPGTRLAAALRALSVNASDVPALIAAGRNALTLGDANAATGFFGRADQLSPRDGRVKAGLGAALVQLERPADALRLFDQAASLGVPEAEFASDRGLARDLTGDPQAAQRDYRAALAARPDDDVARRRLALSEGIAGDRARAIATLDPLIRRRDVAAWRAQTFVLAMTGDAAGANAITRVMLPQQQATLQPFLVRLAALTPAEKARAVHFGEMPTSAVRTAAGASPAPRSDLAPAAPPALAASTPPARALPAPVLAARAPAPATVPPDPVTPAPVVSPPAAAPTRLADAAAPRANPTAVTAGGQRYVRRRRGYQDVFALGAPPYDYVPLAGIALSPRRETVDMTTAFREPLGRHRVASAATAVPSGAVAQPAAPAPSAVSPAPGPTILPAAAAPPPAAATSSPAAAPPVAFAARSDLAAAAPAPETLAPIPSPPPGLPIGSSASAGHYDLPHAVERRAPAPARPVEIARAEPPVRDEVPAAPSARTARHAKATADDVATTEKRDAAAGPAAKGRRKPAATPRDRRDDAPSKTSRRGRDEAKATSRDDDDTAPAGKPGDGGKRSSVKHAARAEKETPSRVYVQVAGGANRDDMGKAWGALRKRAPELMKGRSPTTTPLKATNRLLVGPFKDEDEAQAFVNKAAGKGVSGFVFKSAKGQKIDKIDSGE